MSQQDASSPERPDGYKSRLRALQIELVKLQKQVIETNGRVLVILEGRDGAGKDGAIKRIVQHLSPRETRVVALGKPTERDQSAWYFQRYAPHLPVGGEIVLFNRSWYNRAGVERVMGFCTEPEYEEFMDTVVGFEQMLTRAGITLRKYYLDISKAEQKKRLKDRREDPLSQWKISPIDEAALEHWKDYSEARDAMLARTHHVAAPWTVVHTDDKKSARLNLIADLLVHMAYKGKHEPALRTDPDVVFEYAEACHKAGLLAE
jgi:polyphosphate kinase 2